MKVSVDERARVVRRAVSWVVLGLCVGVPAAGGCNGDDAAEGPCFTLADGSCVQETFTNPPVLRANADGVHELTLQPTEWVVAGQRHCVRAYNGVVPGPTIETPARVGDEQRHVRVDLSNALRRHDFRSLKGDDSCRCESSSGQECSPSPHHPCQTADPDCSCTNDEGEACEHMFDFNVTNLHAHGSHVRPDYARGGEPCAVRAAGAVSLQCRECGTDLCDDDTSDDTCFFGDDVISTVHPASGAQFRWDIDEDGTHHEGLHWYHPHIHGTTAIQTGSGAAGAWIVRGALDEVPGLREARERTLVFMTPSIGNDQGFAPLAEGQACTEETITFNNFGVLASTGAKQLNVINGVRQPRMVTAPGQVERWRLLNAAFLDESTFGLFRGSDNDCSSWSVSPEDTIQLRQIARDGITLPQMFADDYVFTSSGYRVEAVFGGADELRDGDTWCFVAARFLQASEVDHPFLEQPSSPTVAPTRPEILDTLRQGDVIAILNVSAAVGAATVTALPDFDAIAATAPSTDLGGRSADELCAEAAAIDDPAAIDQVAVLQVGFFTADDPDPCGCANYNVNCKNFELTDRSRYAFDRDLPLDAVEHWRVGASVDGHPFHIHINPFLVCPDDNVFDPLPFAHWRDTYLVNLDRNIDLITQNSAFTGAYVFHCHKLTHEDDGMMQIVRVCDPAEDPTCGDYGWRVCDPDDLACAQALAATDCAIAAENDVEAAACVASLGGPTGVCGPLACADTSDCMPPGTCVDHVCTPP
jgi:FtsP/CotA-like multicopper oxidase with cupredoxin domain